VTLFLIALCALYFSGWYSFRIALPQLVSGWRLAAFAAGIASVWISVASPVAHLDHHLLTAHMVQHLLLMVFAAPLVLLGAPSVVLLHALPRHWGYSVVTQFRTSRLVHRLGVICTHPAFCFLAGSLTVIVWHVPAVFELALHLRFWHAFEHTSFFIAGCLFWWPVIKPWPTIARSSGWSLPIYLFLATLPCDALSAFLTFCGHVVYRPYLSGGGYFGLSPLDDQALAGALMWVTVTFAYLIPALVVTTRLLSSERTRTTGRFLSVFHSSIPD
jgi:putative membrane protein